MAELIFPDTCLHPVDAVEACSLASHSDVRDVLKEFFRGQTSIEGVRDILEKVAMDATKMQAMRHANLANERSLEEWHA